MHNNNKTSLLTSNLAFDHKSNSIGMMMLLCILLSLMLSVVVTVINATESVSQQQLQQLQQDTELCLIVQKLDYTKVLEFMGNEDIGKQIDEFCANGKTPLMIACDSRKRDVAEALVIYGVANVNIMSPTTGETALMVASNKGNLGMVNILLKKGKAKPNLRKKSGATALMLACFAGHVDVVKSLLASGADANAQESTGNSALLLATMRGYVNIVRALVDDSEGNYILNVNARNSKGYSAFDVACMNGHHEIVQILMNEFTIDDCDLQDSRGWTPLMYASQSGHKSVVQEIITSNKCQINVNNLAKDGTSSLLLAAKSGHEEVVDLLLSNNALINIQKTNDGFSALMHASFLGHENIVKLLIAMPGLDVNLREHDGWTALMFASFSGHTAIVRELLKIDGIQVDISSRKENMTASMFACQQKNPSVLRLLISRGSVDLNLRSYIGMNTEDYCAYMGLDDIVALIRSKRAMYTEYNRSSSTFKSDM